MDFSFTFKNKLKPGSTPKPAPSAAESQFNAIRGCGINPIPKVTLNILTAGQDAAAFDAQPFQFLLCLLAGFNEAGEPLSDDIYLLNHQGITAEGDYSANIAHLARITKGALPLEDLRDALDADNAQATVAFTLDGEAVEWTVPIAESTFDPTVLSGLAGIAAQRGDGARLGACALEGFSLIVFLTEHDLAELAETTCMQWTVIE